MSGGAEQFYDGRTEPGAFDEPEIIAAIEQARLEGFREGCKQSLEKLFRACIDDAGDMDKVGRNLCILANLSDYKYDGINSVRSLAILWRVSVSTAQEYLAKNRTRILLEMEQNSGN